MTVSLVFDIVIAVICLFVIIKNAARGFIKSFMVLAKTVLAVFVAYLFNAPLARLFSEKLFLNLSEKWVNNTLVATANGEGGYELYRIFDGIPDWFTKVSMSSGVDSSTIDKYFVQSNIAPQEVVDELTIILGNALSMIISTIVSALLIFIVVEILLIFLGILLNKLGKLPILKFVNILLGATIGVILSAVIAWLISLAIVQVFKFGANYYPDIFKQAIIEDSVIVKFFNEHNLFYIVKDYLTK